MELKITILCDNTPIDKSFKSEHGLSIHFEFNGKTFLWDCGFSDAAVQNAHYSGIDLKNIEGIGISHGHYDHTGGLLPILLLSGPKNIYIHPSAFENKYFVSVDKKRFIGIPYREEFLSSISAGLFFTDGITELIPGVKIIGNIPRVTDFEGQEANLFRETKDGLKPDNFPDDQAIIVEMNDGIVVLTGCAHSGIVNTLKYALSLSKRIKAVIGGTHLMGASTERIVKTLDFLEEILPEKIVPCHCTGDKATALMIERFKERIIPGRSGLSLYL